LCYQKEIAMLHQNFTSNQSSVKIELLLSTAKNNSVPNRKTAKKKSAITEMKMAGAVKANAHVRQ
jgi:hypothetical protein